MLKRLREHLTSDGPGYSDDLEADIRTHRQLAQTTAALGAIGALLGIAQLFLTGSFLPLFAGLAFFFACLWSAASLRKEAVEWRLQDLKRDLEDHVREEVDG